MNHRKIQLLCEAKGLSEEELSALPSWGREQLGIPLVLPHIDYTPMQRFVDNYLPRWAVLRRMYGLDQTVDIEPPFSFDEPNLGRNYSWYNAQLQFELNRRSIYHLVEEMDNFDLVSSALDIYSEEATQTDEEVGRAVWIECDDADIKRELMELFDRIGMEDRVFGLCRSMCKYGDDFEQIIASTSKGVVTLEFIQPQRLTRIEDRFGRLKGFAPGVHTDFEIRDPEKVKKLRISKPWDFIHWRIQSSRREMKHGETVLMAVRRVWRQLKIIEDSLVLYRLNRATDKDIYYIDVGNQTPDQQWQTVHRFRRELRKKFYVNTTTGQMRQQYNPRTADEDLYIPIPKDSNTKVERLSGANPQGDIYDVDHFRNKFFAAIRIPKAFMGYEEDVNAKATLVSQDIRFARGIKRIQRAFKHGTTQLCKVHLALRGHEVVGDDGKDLIKFKVKMAPINYLDEMARAELFTLKHEITMKMLELARPSGDPPMEVQAQQQDQQTQQQADIQGQQAQQQADLADKSAAKQAARGSNKPKAKREQEEPKKQAGQPDGQSPKQQDMPAMQGGSVIKQVDNWVAWVLRKFLGLTDDEMEYFMGDRDAGRTPEKRDLNHMNENERAARRDFEKAAEKANAEGRLEPYKKRIKLLKEAHRLITDPDDLRVDSTFDPLPSKSHVEAWKKIAEKEEMKGVYDLEDEEKKLMKTLGYAGNGNVLVCPVCKEGHLQRKYDSIEEHAYVICSRVGTCGFVAYAEGEMEETAGEPDPTRD